MKRTFILVHQEARNRAIEAVRNAPDGFAVTVGERNRSLDQNAAQWPILQAIAAQLEWPVNGTMTKLSDEEWKDILTAGFKANDVRLAQGVHGGVVMLGQRTSQMDKKTFSDWLEYLHWFCAERGVKI